jgi:multiple sugar transport system permease protein
MTGGATMRPVSALRRRGAWRVAVYVFLSLVLLFNLTPFAWMMLTSLKTDAEALRIPPTLLPEEPTFQAYVDVLVYADFIVYFRNSLIVSLGAAVLSTTLGALAAYGISRFRFSGRGLLLTFVLSTQMLPGILLVGPYFEVLSRVGLYNTYLGVILAFTTLTLPFSVWMLKGYTDTVPRELDQAARVDGCSPFTAYRRVVLPLIMPGVVATLVFAFLLAWGDLLWVLVLTSGDEMATFTLGLTRLVTQFRTFWPQLMAGSVVAVVPCIVLYTWLQRYLVEGLSAGAVKD